MISRELLAPAMSYSGYRKLLDKLLSENKTTGDDQSEENVANTKLNIARMSRLDKTVSLQSSLLQVLKQVNGKYTWLVITEGWCGDTAQNIPVFNHMAKHCPNISLQLILRDENPLVMDKYLTNGSRSIPKLICFEADSLREVFVWGPRPAPLQQLVVHLMKTKPSKEEKGVAIHTWYNNDKTATIQNEFLALIKAHMCN